MPRDLITPLVCTENSTNTLKLSTDKMIMCDTNNAGAYIKASSIDASNLLLVISRTSKNTNAAYIYIRGGSTAGKGDFNDGAYTTLHDLRIKIPHTTRGLNTTAGAQGSSFAPTNPQFIRLTELWKYKDSNGYINIDYSTALSSGGGAHTSQRSYIGAIYLK